MRKCLMNEITKLQTNPKLNIVETLEDLRTWIDYITDEFDNLPLGLLQAYAYILRDGVNKKWNGKEYTTELKKKN